MTQPEAYESRQGEINALGIYGRLASSLNVRISSFHFSCSPAGGGNKAIKKLMVPELVLGHFYAGGQ